MPSDPELYAEYRNLYPKLPIARAAELLAAEHNLSVDSVRKRLHREGVKPRSQVAALKDATMLDRWPSTTQQREIVAQSEKDFAETLHDGKEYTAVFVSDVHLPYIRHDAYALTLDIIGDLQPDYISAANDALDNSNFGRHADSRNISVKWAHAGDLGNLRRVEQHYYLGLKSAAPDAMLLAVNGNHDGWFFRWARMNAPELAEHTIAEYMQWLYDYCDVKQFSVGAENHIQFNTNLVWWHGQFIAASPITNANNTLKQFISDEGELNSVIVGHTHRPVQIDGKLVGMPGVDFINSGCLSRLDPPYMKRAPRGWGLGIAVSHWTGGQRGVKNTLIEFKKRGDVLTAEYAGVKYSTPIDLSMPDER